MELNIEQIRSLALGAAYIEQREEGVCFHRFNREEEPVYEQSPFYSKVFATAGIRLEFETDATALDMTVNAYAITSRSYFRVDILKDGQMLGGIQNYDSMENGTYPAGSYPVGIYSGSFSLGDGVKKVTVQLPWSVPCAVQSLVLPEATFVKPLKRDKKALIYGDSITQGYDSLNPSSAYAVRLCDWLGAEGVNKAVGGEVYCPELAEVSCGFQPDYVLVAYGCNDWHRLTQPEMEDRCQRFWSAVCRQYPDARKIALTPVWIKLGEQSQFGPFEEVENTIRRVTAQFPDITVIRGWELIPHDPALYGDGRIHPNDKGFDRYYENLIRQL